MIEPGNRGLDQVNNPAWMATMVMINSAALPRVALRQPPIFGPVKAAQRGGFADQPGQRDESQAGDDEIEDGAGVQETASTAAGKASSR